MNKVEDRVTQRRIKELQQLQVKPFADALQKIIIELISVKEELRETRGRLDLLEMHAQSGSPRDNGNGCLGFLDSIKVTEVKMPRNGTRRIVEIKPRQWYVQRIIKGSWNVEAGPWQCKRSAQRYIKRTK